MSELSRSFFNDIRQIIKQAKQKAYTTVNFAMVEAYWNIGRRIVEEEQKGKVRAGYGEYLILNLSRMLTDEFGSGFDPSNLKRMRQFYFVFPKNATLWRQSGKEKGTTAWHLLSWSHYKLLISVKSEPARLYYMREAVEQNWSVRALERHPSTRLRRELSRTLRVTCCRHGAHCQAEFVEALSNHALKYV